MDLDALVRERLAMIRRLYAGATRPFVDTIERIDLRQPPFDQDPVGFNPEDGEPPFIKEWIEAEESLNLLGGLCLDLTVVALKHFLEAFLREVGGVLPKRKGSWLQKHREFLASEYGIEWTSSPVAFEFFEQMVLARNDLQHGGELMLPFTPAGKEHLGQFPKSEFIAHPDFLQVVRVSKDKIVEALEKTEAFCCWLEGLRWGEAPKAKGSASGGSQGSKNGCSPSGKT